MIPLQLFAVYRRTDRYQFATEADSNVQGYCNHRTKSNGYYS